MTGTRYLYVIGLLCLIVSAAFNKLGMTSITVLLLVIATVCATKIAEYKNLFHMTWMVGHYAFNMVPVLIIFFSGVDYRYDIAIACTIFTFAALRICSGLTHDRGVGRDTVLVNATTYLLFVATSVGAQFATEGESFIYSMSALAYLYSESSSAGGKVRYTLLFVVLLVPLAIYMVLFWNGFGRLVVVGVMIPPTLILLYRLSSYSLKIPIILCTAFGSIAGTLARIEGSSIQNIFQSAFKDSTMAPLLTGQDIYEYASNYGGGGLRGSIDQFLLFFLGPLPRQLWPAKPSGFGFQYTLENLDENYVNSGHSIASSFAGEHFYYLGIYGGYIGTAAAILLISILYKLIYQANSFGKIGGNVVAVYIPTFYWGGMASFSQRFIIGLVPFLIYIWVRDYIKSSNSDRYHLPNKDPYS